jgi:hypothetical protein
VCVCGVCVYVYMCIYMHMCSHTRNFPSTELSLVESQRGEEGRGVERVVVGGVWGNLS